MSKFNTTASTAPNTTNLASGTAYKMTPELELVTALLTSFLNESFYERAKTRQDRLATLATKVDPLFAAKAAIYARTEFGMRSVTHVIAGELANSVKGEEWTKRFFEKVIFRPDDATEIVAYLKKTHGKKLSHALAKGIAKKLETLDNYQAAKYRGDRKEFKLIDLVNLTHPQYTDTLTALVNDELRNKENWESKVSEAGKSDKVNAKKEAWTEMVKSGRLGYFALLRNLRNILLEAPDILDVAIDQLTDEKKVHKSLVLPFRFVTALREIEKLSGASPTDIRKIIVALNSALDISTANVPKFKGETLVAVDVSGSMYPGWGSGAPIEHAALFGAILAKSNNSDLMVWSDHAKYVQFNPMDSTLTIAQKVKRVGNQGGTNLSAIFQEANRKYDRILILTDEQSWMHNSWYSPKKMLAEYNKRLGANPLVYSWDLQGYGTLQFPEPQVVTLAGWSEKVFDIMKLVETDKKALIRKIESIEI